MVSSYCARRCDCGMAFFFFSSRRRHTRFDCDWSSDVCSSDLTGTPSGVPVVLPGGFGRELNQFIHVKYPEYALGFALTIRSEERRVGKECRSWRWPYHSNKKHTSADI